MYVGPFGSLGHVGSVLLQFLSVMSDMSSMWLLLRRGIRRGVLTLTREREYGTTLGVLCGVAFLAQLLVLLTLGAQSVQGMLQSQLDLRLQVHEGASDQTVQEFLVALQAQPFTESVRFVTREEAYEQERQRNPELTNLLEDFEIDNPYPDTVAVTLKSLTDYDVFAEFTRQPAWKDTVDPAFLTQTTDQEQEVRQMLTLTRAGRMLAIGFLALTGAVLLFVLMELTRRRALLRSEEILVERLFGAREASMLVPFATEAGILLFLAVAISAALIAGLLAVAPSLIPALSGSGAFSALRMETSSLMWSVGPLVLLAEILAIPFLSMAGAYLGMRRKGDMMLG